MTSQLTPSSSLDPPRVRMPSKRKRACISNAPQVTIQESHPLIGHAGPSQQIHQTRNINVPTQGDSRGRLHQVTEHSTTFRWDAVPDLSNLLVHRLGEDEEMPFATEDMVDDPPLPVIDDVGQTRETDAESVRRTVSKLTFIFISCTDCDIRGSTCARLAASQAGIPG